MGEIIDIRNFAADVVKVIGEGSGMSDSIGLENSKYGWCSECCCSALDPSIVNDVFWVDCKETCIFKVNFACEVELSRKRWRHGDMDTRTGMEK